MKKIFLLSLIIALISCVNNSKKEIETPKLYITKSILKVKLGSEEESKDTRETYVFSDTYIELNLSQSTLGGFLARYKFPGEEGSDGIYTSTLLMVTDKEGTELKYENTAAFLNYMLDMGYEMTTEKNHKYGNVYTFKKI